MTFKKALRNIIIGCIFLVPLVPLVMSDAMFFPFITGRNFFFRLLVEIAFASWLILALKDAEYRPRFSWLLASILGFIALIAVSDFAGVNPYKSFWSNFERMEGLVTLLHLGAYVVVAGNVLREERLWKYLFNTTIGVSIIVSIVGFMQLAGKVGINQSASRLDANFGNATYLAIYMLFHIFLVAFVTMRYVRRKTWGTYSFAAAIMIIQAIVLYYTATRGALLGLLGGAGMVGLLVAIFEREHKTMRKAAIGVIVALIVIIGGFFAIRNTAFVRQSQVLSRFASISLTEATTQSRFIIWNMAWQGFRERPVLGWGQENFNYVFNEHYNPKMYAQEQWFDRTHNVILDWLIAGGIPGIVLYLSMFGFVLYYIWKQSNEDMSVVEKSILTGMLTGYFIHNLFVFDNVISYIVFFTILAYVYSRRSWPVERMQTYTPTEDLVNMVYAPIVTVLLILTAYNVIIVPYLQNTTLIEALSPQETGGPAENLRLFKQVFAYEAFGNSEAREQLLQLSSQIPTSQVDDETKRGFAELTDSQMLKQLRDTPNDARYHIFYGSYLNRTGRYKEAMTHLENALRLSPNKQSIMFEMGSVLINDKQYARAVEVLGQAHQLEPAYEDARINYALSAVYASQLDVARKAMEGYTITYADDRLINIYAALKDYPNVLELWKLKTAADPNNAQNHMSLATVHLLLNQRPEAIAEIEKAIELDPKLKSNGEYFIKEIRAGRNPVRQ